MLSEIPETASQIKKTSPQENPRGATWRDRNQWVKAGAEVMAALGTDFSA